MLRFFGVLCVILAMASCHRPAQERTAITLDTPRKGYWFLSEKFSYQFMRVELYDNHIEGLPSLTMEFRIKAESLGATWKEDGNKVSIRYLKPEAGTVTLTPIADKKIYNGRYLREGLALPLVEVRIGKQVKVMHYTESDTEMERLLRAKNKLKLDVVWGATPVEVMQTMFAFTHPTAQDTMFDLGCGDARILVAAAKRFGTRGVGYDLDPQLIQRGNAAAKAQGVAHLITLKTENLFTADLSPATIVAIYLSDRINSKLKPKFFRELKPGTRIVSHNWHMGDWQADNRKFMSDRSRVVYYYVVPANFSGVWQSADGTTLRLKQHYQMVDAEIVHAGKTLNADGLKVVGTRLELAALTDAALQGALEIAGQTATLKNKGSVAMEFQRKADTEEPFAM